MTCPNCDGHGELLVFRPAERQRFSGKPVDEDDYLVVCETCNGSGKIEVEEAAA